MSPKKSRITWMDRLEIEKLFNLGASYRAIARKIGFALSSVYKEVQRGLYDHLDGSTWKTLRRYSADIAQQDADWQATAHGCSIKLGTNHEYARTVALRIQSGESPDQIVGDMKVRQEWTVSTPTLYRYIDQGYIPGITNMDLWTKAQKKKRPYRRIRAAHPPKASSIEHRPPEVDARSTFGHWEMDSVIGRARGKSESVLVLTERMTRFEIICKVAAKTSAATVAALSKIVRRFPAGTFQSITVDNGSEFQDADGIQGLVGSLFYCHPYTSCERGSNENANRIIRRFLPKGRSMKNIRQKDCNTIAHYINNMHRKILNYRTAADLFSEQLSILRKAAS